MQAESDRCFTVRLWCIITSVLFLALKLYNYADMIRGKSSVSITLLALTAILSGTFAVIGLYSLS